ncbi:MAG: AAA family ATPase [Bryobacterales bacterium]|nr:AAA family ATPase [Acidobacteriota bacterium]MCB9384118.1 AAA family ATPase [Bryobacterales bacterium]
MAKQPLDWITVRGFKSISAIERLELRPINILIGPNGSGKSNFIAVFEFLHAIRSGRLRVTVTQAGGADSILHYGSKTTSEISFELSFEKGNNSYQLKLRPTADDGLYPYGEAALFKDGSHFTHLEPRENGREAGISDSGLTSYSIPGYVKRYLGSWRVYHVHDTSASSPMRSTAQLDDNRFLRANGSNLAAFLYLLQEKHADEYSTIVGAIRQVAPFLDDFVLEPLELRPDTIKLEWRHTNSDQYFAASSLSDGTLRFIVLATLLLQPAKYRPSVILIDEPELGLHPSAIELLSALIRHVSTETQVIISTQSSVLIDHFEPEDVLVADRRDGGTRLRRLDSSSLKSWLEDYSLGQLWEKGELGGRPTPE